MAAYFNIPEQEEAAKKAVRDSSYPPLREVLLIYLGKNKELLKLVLDYDVDRDYSNHTILYRERFDSSTQENWEGQVNEILRRFKKL